MRCLSMVTAGSVAQSCGRFNGQIVTLIKGKQARKSKQQVMSLLTSDVLKSLRTRRPSAFDVFLVRSSQALPIVCGKRASQMCSNCPLTYDTTSMR